MQSTMETINPAYQSFMYLQTYMVDEDKSEASSLTKKKILLIIMKKILRQGIM